MTYTLLMWCISRTAWLSGEQRRPSACPSVPLSVCLSVACWQCVKTNCCTLGSPGTVFWDRLSCWGLRETLLRGHQIRQTCKNSEKRTFWTNKSL